MTDRRTRLTVASSSSKDDAQLSLFGPLAGEETVPSPSNSALTPDEAARAFAVDPRNNVVLEASAGTGKTSVLVARYVNLVKQGVEPAHILAITFTRKAAAEMRERIVAQLREAADRSQIDKARWTELRDRLGEVAISTIDAFCLSLLREFPLEADLDPGFEMADETEVPRLIGEALDRALRILVSLAKDDADVALVLAQLGIARTRAGLASLLDRRLVARSALDRFLARGPADLTPQIVCGRAADGLYDVLRGVPGGLPRFLADGPAGHGRYQLFTREVGRLTDWQRSRASGRDRSAGDAALTDAEIRGLLERIGSHFLTNDGTARRSGRIYPYVADDYPSKEAERRHREGLFQIAPAVERVISAFHRDLNVVLARGVRRMFAIALQQYRDALEERSVLDFSDVLQRALDLLRQMGEFSQSRYRLESRFHHVLVDEFQDTSRAQWELISLLIQAWGEGLGLASQPSVFIVGDRKQSIYRFRDAEVAVLREAAGYIDSLRPGGTSRRAISRSFRGVPTLQAFVNDVFTEMAQSPAAEADPGGRRGDDFTFDESDRFPVDASSPPAGAALGIAVGDSPDACAAAVAEEVRRILDEATVRDRDTGVARRATAGDIAILFRSRTSHREFERELMARGIPAYVYKGLGFFDADEIKDITALLRYLAHPGSDLRAAALLRSRFLRLSDAGLAALAPRLADALTGPRPHAWPQLNEADQLVLGHARAFVPRWLDSVDRVPPSDLLEQILADTAYAYEIRGARRAQAWENIKKMRGLVRRMQNRGYATLTRLADHLDSLGAGDESNAILEAIDAVNLMTIHASKGLEFPIVFLVNLARGASGPPLPVRVIVDGNAESVSVGPFASEMEEADRERETHETRRLLYVAMTRARDRLYLSASLKDGKLVPGRGSLADVLPMTLQKLFEQAAAPFEATRMLGWRGASGTAFEWRVCPPAGESQSSDATGSANALSVGKPTHSGLDWFGEPAAACGILRAPVTGSDWGHTGVQPGSNSGGGLTNGVSPATSPTGLPENVVGTLVHRLFQSMPLLQERSPSEHDSAAFVAFARDLLKPEERVATPDVDRLARAAVDAWQSMRSRPDVLRVLESGLVQHEVPFSLLVAEANPPVVLRGTVDCLVCRPDGSVVVVEFKTGRPSPDHERQLDLYVRAAQACYPAAKVERLLVYL